MNDKSTKKSILPPFLFPSTHKTHQAWMTQLLKKGLIRSIGPRLYTSLPPNQVPSAIKGCWSDIVSHLFPHILLSHRSALEYHPNSKGEMFLTGTTNRQIHYPGLTLVFIRGPRPLSDDSAFLNFRVSSFPRALLENLSSTKRTAQRAAPITELEQKLVDVLQIKGEKELNKIRDRARAIAKQLKWGSEFKKLDAIIGGILGTRPDRKLHSEEAKARSIGKPYDSAVIEKLDLLFSELRHASLPIFRNPFKSTEHLRNKAFFESYFSNYIEGTVFEIEEAEQIIFQNKIPEERPQDGHDILATFQLISNPNEMKQTPNTFPNFELLIQNRHRILMQARPQTRPGHYKLNPNRAGNTHFTAPELVQGTLEKGIERYLLLPTGLPRAIFIMFLIVEVHPFTDGNGRIARIMMNAELFSEELTTIIIPTVYREDYQLTLRALTRMNRPKPLIQMLTKAQKISNHDFSVYPNILKYIETHNWFKEPSDAHLIE